MASDKLCQQNMDVLDNIKVPYTRLGPDEISKRYPGLSSQGSNGVLDYSGGVLNANKCLQALKVTYEKV